VTRARAAAAFAMGVALSCSKPAASTAPDAGTASPGIDAGVPPATAAATPQPSAAPAAATTYAGTYKTQPGSLYISEEKDYANVKQPKDDGSLVGEGTFTLSIDESGRATGVFESGPVAPATISATRTGDVLTGTVRRREAADEGLTGSLSAALKGADLEGALELANANASILREGKMTAVRK
jgi:hypothetical protein